MDQSKGRLALAESMQLHRERVGNAHKRVHAAQNELEEATRSLQLAVKAQEAFIASMRGNQRHRQLPYDGRNKRQDSGAKMTASLD